MALRDMEHDCPQLEQGEIALLIGRNLPERMKRKMRGFLHLAERNKTDVVRLAHFFERPTNTHVTCLSLAAVGRPFKGCDSGGHWKAPRNCMTVENGVRNYDDFLMVRYSVLALCKQRTSDRRAPRQLTSFFWQRNFAVRTFCGRYRRTTLNPSVGEELKMALNRHRQLIERPLCAGATSGFLGSARSPAGRTSGCVGPSDRFERTPCDQRARFLMA